MRCLSINAVATEKEELLKLCMFEAIVIQHANSVLSHILPSVASLALPYISTIHHKNGTIFVQKLLNVK